MVSVREATVILSNDVEVVVDQSIIVIKGNCGTLSLGFHSLLNCRIINKTLVFTFHSKKKYQDLGKSLLGTTCSLVRAMLLGVTIGFTRKLQLIGVGYRAAIVKDVVSLTVGFSHVVDYKLPNGVSADCPTSVDIVLHSSNKQLIGQVAADLRAIRPPEAFSGKGIRYIDEIVRIKEVKKK